MMTAYINELVYLTIILCISASVIYFLSNGNSGREIIARILAITALLVSSLALIARTLLVDRLPLANGAEYMLWFGWFTILTYLFFEIWSKNRGAGGMVMLFSALLVGTIPLLMPHQLGDLSNLMPALKSPWLTSHVLTAVVAYGCFAVAAGIAAMYLWKGSMKSDIWISRIVGIGFVFLTITIVLGAIWAEQAWGRYWSWDPKETWALVTWIVYAIYFHLQRQKAWQGKKGNILVVGGFILVLFTFFGVNFLLSGLHSYA